MAKKKTKKRTKKRFNTRRFVLNCVPPMNPEDDWSIDDAIDSGVFTPDPELPKKVDLRRAWWRVDDQGTTGACVGFATAYGVLRWHYLEAGLIDQKQKPSARFIWMANKETDDFTNFPTTFLESAGTQTKLALRVARNYGCVLEGDLPMSGKLSALSSASFYTRAARLRISSYHNLGSDPDARRQWLAFKGPILTRLGVDRTWDRATETNGYLEEYQPATVRGGHAVCLVGYTQDHFIVRNSWGRGWGDKGFAYASNDYAAEAFTEAYGAVM